MKKIYSEKTKCLVSGCKNKVSVKGMCTSHYYQRKRWASGINIRRTPCQNISCDRMTNTGDLCSRCKRLISRYKKWDDTQKRKTKNQRTRMMGENNPRWSGGNSQYPNHALFKKNRLLRLKMANCICEICKKRKARQVHHVDRNKSNHKISNLRAVCIPCHINIHIDSMGKPRKYKELSHIADFRKYNKIRQTLDWLKNNNVRFVLQNV